MTDPYIRAELRLARLLRPDCVISNANGVLVAHGEGKAAPNYEGCAPKWARDNEAAFALMVEYRCEPRFMAECVLVTCRASCDGAHYDDHDGMEAAVRYAIVMSVIENLEATKR